MAHAVYIDHNATTPVRPQAAAAVMAALASTGNPSSVHRHGRLVRRLVEDARERVAALVGAAPEAVVFTSGGTEANALALRSTGRPRVLVSAVEHASVRDAVETAEVLPVDGDGVVDLEALAAMLASTAVPALVSVMLANNETGVLQPVAAVAAVARRFGALVHCDAVQAAGKVAVDVRHLGVHLLALSAHKIGGPAGVGALIVEDGVALAPQRRGGGQERGRRPGTENVSGIAGFGAAAEAATAAADGARLARLRDRWERGARELAPAAAIFGEGAARLPNTSCVAMPGVAAETQVMALDLAGISVSAGAACSSGKVVASAVLRAMNVDETLAASALRVSFGWTSVEDDVDRLLEAWGGIYTRLGCDARARAPAA
ncbi:MAG: cysteine desulfurase family protein [Rhodospirillales bacterium]